MMGRRGSIDITGYNMYAYCGNNPIYRIDATGMFWSSVKKALHKGWNTVKSWVKNAFSVDVNTTTKIPVIDIGEIVNIEVGIKETTTIENNTNNIKPISLYTSTEVDDAGVNSAIGIKSDIFNTDVSIGTSGISYSKSNSNLFGETSMTYSVTPEGRLEYECAHTVTWNNVEYTVYISESTPWQIPALALAVATCRWEAIPALMPSVR